MTTARDFTLNDWRDYPGAEQFPNGDKPVIRELAPNRRVIASNRCAVAYFEFGELGEDLQDFGLDHSLASAAEAKTFLDELPQDLGADGCLARGFYKL